MCVCVCVCVCVCARALERVSTCKTYHIEHRGERPAHIVKGHAQELQCEIVESNHANKNGRQWHHLRRRKYTE